MKLIKNSQNFFGKIQIPLQQPTFHMVQNPNFPKTITIDHKEVISTYQKMYTMRKIELLCDQFYKEQKIQGFCHTYDGEEGLQLGMDLILTDQDPIITGYRIHCLSYLRGIPPYQIFAEVFGHKDGHSKGKGGSMHLYNSKTNFYGGTGLVGDQIALGAGLGFALKYKNNKKNVAVIYYGDGASNQGQFFESINMSYLKKWPVIYVCENNQYALGTPVSKHSSGGDDFERRLTWCPGIHFFADDVFETKAVTKWTKDYVLKNGPIILNAETYRFHGHGITDSGMTYRTREEVLENRKNRDPLILLKNKIFENNILTEKQLHQIQQEIKQNLESESKKAWEIGDNNWEVLLEDVYSDDMKHYVRAPNYEDSIFIKEKLVN